MGLNTENLLYSGKGTTDLYADYLTMQTLFSNMPVK